MKTKTFIRRSIREVRGHARIAHQAGLRATPTSSARLMLRADKTLHQLPNSYNGITVDLPRDGRIARAGCVPGAAAQPSNRRAQAPPSSALFEGD